MAEVITDDTERRRYELMVDGERAALIAYGRKAGIIALTHTETEEGFGGKGYATKLVEHVLEDARASETAVLPFCPFVQHYLVTHPESQSLVPEAYREQFGLVGAAS